MNRVEEWIFTLKIAGATSVGLLLGTIIRVAFDVWMGR